MVQYIGVTLRLYQIKRIRDARNRPNCNQLTVCQVRLLRSVEFAMSALYLTLIGMSTTYALKIAYQETSEYNPDKSLYSKRRSMVYAIIGIDMLVIVVFIVCVVKIVRFFNKKEGQDNFDTNYHVILTKASFALVTWATRIVAIYYMVKFNKNNTGFGYGDFL